MRSLKICDKCDCFGIFECFTLRRGASKKHVCNRSDWWAYDEREYVNQSIPENCLYFTEQVIDTNSNHNQGIKPKIRYSSDSVRGLWSHRKEYQMGKPKLVDFYMDINNLL